jgi:hypothetical protein
MGVRAAWNYRSHLSRQASTQGLGFAVGPSPKQLPRPKLLGTSLFLCNLTQREELIRIRAVALSPAI